VRRNTILPAQEALSSFTRRSPTRFICGSRFRPSAVGLGGGDDLVDAGGLDVDVVVLGSSRAFSRRTRLSGG
jgi:hypothetical protein